MKRTSRRDISVECMAISHCNMAMILSQFTIEAATWVEIIMRSSNFIFGEKGIVVSSGQCTTPHIRYHDGRNQRINRIGSLRPLFAEWQFSSDVFSFQACQNAPMVKDLESMKR